MADSPDKSPQNTDQPAPKKPYRAPRLEVYGDLRKITNHVGMHGLTDHIIFLRTHA